MKNLDHVVLIGNITRDLGSDEKSFGYIGNGTAKANISIAVNSSKKQGDQWVDEANFFTVTIFGKTAENLKPYLTKGTKVAIEGHLKQDRWEKDGQKHSAISIIADNVELCGGGKKDSNSASNSAPTQQSFGADDGFPEDVPF